METIDILLKNNEGKTSVNVSEGLNVNLVGNRKLLSIGDVSETVSQFDVYNEERKNCTKLRLTCQVNPVCSNVLFNRITEIVKDEGSDNVTFLNYGVCKDNKVFDNVDFKKDKDISFWSGGTMNYDGTSKQVTSSIKHPTNAIRDTQLSSTKNGFIYHCGLDILNNHLIRSTTFKTICKSQDRNEAFNTLFDKMRDVQGNAVSDNVYFPQSAGITNGYQRKELHIYKYDDILTYNDAINTKLTKKYNGWVGFSNDSKIKSYSDFADNKELEIERPLMYMSGGDFVDMYPSRDLYSFVPKYNTFRHRIEKNWNYALTYPSSSTTKGFESIIDKKSGGLKAVYFNENTVSDNGMHQLVIYGIAKHGLNVGDFVNIYKSSELVIANAEVMAVVDDYIFTVFSDVKLSSVWVMLNDEERVNVNDSLIVKINGVDKSFNLEKNGMEFFWDQNYEKKYYIVNDYYVNFDEEAQDISYKKSVGGIECDYYVRIFSRLPNFKYAAGDTSNEYQLYKDNGKMIDTYQGLEYDFESHVSRLAFAKNIYTDEIGELVFTDDIDIANLKDNLGRPLSSIYLTFIKNNKGYKEWYGFGYKEDDWKNNIQEMINSPKVEFSHCFGPIYCGLKTSYESKSSDGIPSINRISTDLVNCYPLNVNEINPDRVNDNDGIDMFEVWYDTDKHFYGDLCCYDTYNATETSLQQILHRINSAQREANQSKSRVYFSSYITDEIRYDDYDTQYDFMVSANTHSNCNNLREGYYYEPHYEIKVKSFDKLRTAMPDFLTIRQIEKVNDNTYRVTVLQQHFLSVGDKTMIYNNETGEFYHCITVSGDSDTYKVFTCQVFYEKPKKFGDGNEPPTDKVTDLDALSLSTLVMFKMDNLAIPSYAKVMRDGTCRLVWRDIIQNGFDKNNGSDVEQYPFTNGALYINKRVDIYLRRQDPYNLYGLYDEFDIKGDDVIFDDNYADEEEMEC